MLADVRIPSQFIYWLMLAKGGILIDIYQTHNMLDMYRYTVVCICASNKWPINSMDGGSQHTFTSTCMVSTDAYSPIINNHN